MKILLSYILLLAGFLPEYPVQNLTEKGVPYLKNFSPTEYDHGGKIWDIDASPNEIVYMASNGGLLEYDGIQWNSYSGSDGITRSVLVASDSLIYTGSDLDFGVWNRNDLNEFEYQSLYPFKEDLNQISEEFWGIHQLEDIVFFVSSANIYAYRNGNLTKIAAPVRVEDSFTVDDTLYFTDNGNSLYELQNLTPVEVVSLPGNTIANVVGLYRQQESMILVTQNAGLFELNDGEFSPINSALSENLRRANVFSFETINDSYLAFGTILKGVYISDRGGNLLHHVTKNKGLQNNTILSMFYSDAGKLWLGMDYGVSFLDLGNDYTFFYDYRGEFGTGHSAVLDGNRFYLGTNQGLYVSDWDDLNNRSELNDFELIPGTEGQVWTLQMIDNRLFIGHDRGLFVYDEGSLTQLNGNSGYWTLIKYRDVLLGGTYNGISIFQKENDEWRYLRNMDLILGSCNQLHIEGDDKLWVNIPNFGVIRAELNDSLNPDNRQIFRSDQFDGQYHTLSYSGDSVAVVTDDYRYTYQPQSGEFIRSSLEIKPSEVDDQLVGNASPVRLNKDYEFIPVYNGFALHHLTSEGLDRGKNPTLIFRKLEVFNNDEQLPVHAGVDISPHLNNLRIVSVVPNREDVLYQLRTEESEGWSEWSNDGTFELVGISYGNHTIEARAMVDGVKTPVNSVTLTIASPWYQSWPAIIVYLLVGSLALLMLFFWQGMSLSKQRKHLLMDQRRSLNEQKERYNRELERVEEDKLRAEYEKLKAQLKSKTIELATKAKDNDEKRKILKTLSEKFELLKNNPKSLKRRSDEIQRIIEDHIETEDNTFEIQIDEMHQEFFERLRTKFPELTRYDLRLCVYIKIGFDSKEISDLLNIKPSSVYISRSRLRKKLEIGSDEDLHTYLNSL